MPDKIPVVVNIINTSTDGSKHSQTLGSALAYLLFTPGIFLWVCDLLTTLNMINHTKDTTAGYPIEIKMLLVFIKINGQRQIIRFNKVMDFLGFLYTHRCEVRYM